MVVSSLVLTLDPSHSPASFGEPDDPRVTFGRPRGAYVPVVVEAETERESEHIARSLRDREGVLQLDVVMIDFSDGQ